MKILYGEPGPTVAALTATLDAALVFIDFDPFPEKQPWRKEFLDRVSTTVYEVDGHNIIPAWIVSPKKEYSAATFRRKVHPLLDSYLETKPWFLLIFFFVGIAAAFRSLFSLLKKFDQNKH